MAKKLCISPAASTPPQATVAKNSQKAFLSKEATGAIFRSTFFFIISILFCYFVFFVCTGISSVSI
jgi:hypothetical protein